MRLSAQLHRIALASTLALLHEAAFTSTAPISNPPPAPADRPADTAPPPGQGPGAQPCGRVALSAVANRVGATIDTSLPTPAPDPKSPCATLADLERTAARIGLDMKSVRRAGTDPWPAPSIVHWRVGHFSAVIDRAGSRVLLDDPMLGGKVWRDARWLDCHASGYGLVPADRLDANWPSLSSDQAACIRGGQRTYPPTLYDDDDEECPTDEEITSQPMDPEAPNPGELTACPLPETCPPGHGGDECDGLGMPVWRVSEPLINLWVKDVPLYYTMSNGRIMPLVLRYKQRGSPLSTNVFGFGNSWECSWLGYFDTAADSSVTLRVPGGGKRRYDGVLGGPVRGAGCELVAATVHGDGSVSYTVSHRSLCANQYAQAFPGAQTNTLHLLSQKADPHGRVIRFVYSTNDTMILLSRVIDYDGKVSELFYTNRQFPRFVTSVRDPYGREARFQYDTNGNLVRIVDVAGITNTFRYSSDGFLDAMMTPYGRTRFRTWSVETGLEDLPSSRSLGITLPNGERQAYAYYERLDTECVPDYYPDCPRLDDEVPEPVAPGPLNLRGSFFWSSRQLALVTNDWPIFSPQDFRLARWRHWNMKIVGNGPRIGTRLLLERAPSPDGIAEGHRRWYTYFYDYWTGNDTAWLSQQAERLPDGTIRYVRWQRNEWGLPFSIESTFSDGSALGVRQTWLWYDSTGCRLTEVYGPESDTSQWPMLTRSYAYNFNGQITSAVNALGETTSATYNPLNHHLTSVTYPFGLTITNRLDSIGFLTQRVWIAASGAPLATNACLWSQGRVRETVDARGLKTTCFWDALGRLTGRAYPDGTTISNWYVKLDGVPFTNGTGGLTLLDRTRFKDRLGYLTDFACDALRQPIAITNALGHTTRFTWCNCGTVESLTDPMGHTTSLEHDLDGRPVAVHLPGGSTLRIALDSLGRPTNVTDTVHSLALAYNHQGLHTTLATATSVIQRVEYDGMDRPRLVDLPTGAQYEFAYDRLGRLIRRTERRSQGSESVGYAPGVPWPATYTNQTGTNVLLLAYDALGRITRQIQGTVDSGSLRAATTNSFTYNAAGDLLSILDPLNRRTTWTYDSSGHTLKKVNAAGRVAWTNAYDAHHQLVAHWTPARSNLTTCTYDSLGRLTRVDFSAPSTADLAFAYDAAGRLTAATDGIGTTRFAWDPSGVLAGEDGPWANDNVFFGRDSTLALRTLALEQPDAPYWLQTFAYDGDGRLARLVSPAGDFTYAYRGSQMLLASIARLDGAAIAQDHDALGRLLRTTLSNPQGDVLNRHHYDYNAAHQRTRQTFAEGNTIDYAYDALGQVISARGYEPNRTTRQHEQFTYRYDAAGNLVSRQNGASTLTLSVNLLNQLATASRGTATLVAGMTTPAATNVTVNGQAAALYQDRTFARPNLSLPTGPATLTAVARDALGRSATDTLTVTLPGSVAFAYDANGNLIRDGRRLFTYDDHDQLVALIVTNGINESTLSEFLYDAFGRKRILREKTWQTNQWIQTDETRYVYAGLLVLQERGADNQPRVTYTRGPDLSGDLDQAGGIGGLLAMTLHTPDDPRHYYYHADGSGNVTALVDSRHNVVARYRYDPFGNLQGLAGPLAEANRIRFSSKEFHSPSGLSYFGFRFYDPNLQRWINQDPVEEMVGLNLTRFADNAPLKYIDPNGESPTVFLGGIGMIIGGVVGGISSHLRGDGFWQGAYVGAISGGLIGLTGGLAAAGTMAAADALGAGAAIGAVAGGAVGSMVGDLVAQNIESLSGDRVCLYWNRTPLSVVTCGSLSSVACRAFYSTHPNAALWSGERGRQLAERWAAANAGQTIGSTSGARFVDALTPRYLPSFLWKNLYRPIWAKGSQVFVESFPDYARFRIFLPVPWRNSSILCTEEISTLIRMNPINTPVVVPYFTAP